jgi:hypothetical protein
MRGDDAVLEKFVAPQLRDGSAVVVRARALNSSRPSGSEKSAATRFRVQDTWAGSTGKVITVRHSTFTAMCGVVFKKGQSVLLLANRSDEAYSTSSCSQIMADRMSAWGKARVKALAGGK